MKLSVIILNYNTSDMTHKAVNALLASDFKGEIEVIIIDNGSNEKLENFNDERIRIFHNQENLGFARGVNQALDRVSGDYVLLLNSDVIVAPDSISSLINYCEANDKCGIISPMITYPNKKFQTSSGLFPNGFREFLRFSTLWKLIPGGTLTPKNFLNYNYFKSPQKVDWVSGGCLLFRSALLKQLGKLDEKFFFGVEDFDFCFRAKAAGWQVIYYPLTQVIHYHGFSSGGRRSTSSLKCEAEGMNYFLIKNFPKKKLLRGFVNLMYQTKIAVLNSLFSSLKQDESFTRK